MLDRRVIRTISSRRSPHWSVFVSGGPWSVVGRQSCYNALPEAR
ncbi:MAG: hypothetical protein AVDCRST_MAG93-9878 [uncultured Chloroflexia bacterium]|uniref:Uncharacterized protein n=1 Tax=uncultured Chloroflexia bacterium TaxID=1672391 RepID=A0A6J4NWW1_9CHLR|nr:MAG: hypothetical protein AVDCRST_MAG93-9878 [uncultured Chloroflexia bacterium]